MITLLAVAALHAQCSPSLGPLVAAWSKEQPGIDCVQAGPSAFSLSADFPEDRPDRLAVPVAVGAVAVTYNLLVAGDLRLTPQLAADIFQGRIARWSDARIGAANPGVRFPDLPIVAVREDDSAFALLSAWLQPLGGAGAPGERSARGPAEVVARIEGAIAVVDAGEARRQNLYLASLRNKAGAFVQPGMHSLTRAAVGVRIPGDFRARLTDPEGADSYPLSRLAFALVPVPASAGLLDYLGWAIHGGQLALPPLGWAPLPGLLVRLVDERLTALARR